MHLLGFQTSNVTRTNNRCRKGVKTLKMELQTKVLKKHVHLILLEKGETQDMSINQALLTANQTSLLVTQNNR